MRSSITAGGEYRRVINPASVAVMRVGVQLQTQSTEVGGGVIVGGRLVVSTATGLGGADQAAEQGPGDHKCGSTLTLTLESIALLPRPPDTSRTAPKHGPHIHNVQAVGSTIPQAEPTSISLHYDKFQIPCVEKQPFEGVSSTYRDEGRLQKQHKATEKIDDKNAPRRLGESHGRVFRRGRPAPRGRDIRHLN